MEFKRFEKLIVSGFAAHRLIRHKRYKDGRGFVTATATEKYTVCWRAVTAIVVTGIRSVC